VTVLRGKGSRISLLLITHSSGMGKGKKKGEEDFLLFRWERLQDQPTDKKRPTSTVYFIFRTRRRSYSLRGGRKEGSSIHLTKMKKRPRWRYCFSLPTSESDQGGKRREKGPPRSAVTGMEKNEGKRKVAVQFFSFFSLITSGAKKGTGKGRKKKRRDRLHLRERVHPSEKEKVATCKEK